MTGATEEKITPANTSLSTATGTAAAAAATTTTTTTPTTRTRDAGAVGWYTHVQPLRLTVRRTQLTFAVDIICFINFLLL